MWTYTKTPILPSRRRQRMKRENAGRGDRPVERLSVSGFPAGLVASIVTFVAIVSGLLISSSKSEFGAFLALVFASSAGGSFVGFLVGAPGLRSGDEEQQEANERGWADRLGIFGNWVTGAAFVLLVANGAEVADWFASMTATVAKGSGGRADIVYQYSLGAWMIAAAGLGFTIGFMQMVTTGRNLIGAANKVKGAANGRQEAAEAPAQSAEAAKEGPGH